MSILEQLNAVEVEAKKRDEESKRKQMEAEEAKIREQKEKEWKEKKEKKEKEIREVLMDDREGIDEPKVYEIRFSFKERWERVGVEGGRPMGGGEGMSRIIMTEREFMMAKVLGNLLHECTKHGYYNGCQLISCDIVSEKLTDKEEIDLETARKKVQIIKSSSQDEKSKKAVISYSHGMVETDDGHAALCAMNINKGDVELSDGLERKEAEIRRVEAERQDETYRKEHPVLWKLSNIKNALKNRSRGRE